jgi:hypothetical protein
MYHHQVEHLWTSCDTVFEVRTNYFKTWAKKLHFTKEKDEEVGV